MKRILLTIIALLVFASIAQSQAINPTERIKQLQNELAKKDVIIADLKAERNGFILQIANSNANIKKVNNGVDKATILLQKGYDSGKLNYQKLWEIGFRINIDTSNVYQRPTKPDQNKEKQKK